MKSFVAVSLTAVASAATFKESFLQYITKFGKSYTTVEEFNLRMELFAKTDAFINKHNSLLGSGYRMGHNKFSDFTETEWEAMNTATAEYPRQASHYINLQSTPSPVDWRALGAVSPIQDQG